MAFDSTFLSNDYMYIFFCACQVNSLLPSDAVKKASEAWVNIDGGAVMAWWSFCWGLHSCYGKFYIFTVIGANNKTGINILCGVENYSVQSLLASFIAKHMPV